LRRAKKVSIGASLRYGWRLTVKHLGTLVPGTIVFYLPELAQRLGADLTGWGWARTAWQTLVGCWLLWHALQLSDRETRASRLHQAVVPAAGYLGRFLSSTGLFWGGLMLGLWPSLRLLSGHWDLGGWGQLGWLARPWAWSWDQVQAVGWAALVSLPAGLWCVYGWFHGYYVADEGQGAWQSMRSSFQAVRGAYWRTVMFLAVIGALNALGLALWVVGIFMAFPVTLMATTYIHLQLKKQSPGLRSGLGRQRHPKRPG
jgi:hypothetical protein